MELLKKQCVEKSASFCRLPGSILALIFGYLKISEIGNARLVCSTFRHIRGLTFELKSNDSKNGSDSDSDAASTAGIENGDEQL